MLFRNPRLAAISKRVNDMDLDQLSTHILKNNFQKEALNMIYEDFVKRRGPIHDIEEMLPLVPLRNVFSLKVTSEKAIQNIRKFLIHKERNKDESKGTNQAESY